MSLNKKELFYKSLDLVNRQVTKYQNIRDGINEFNSENNLHPDFDEYGNKGEMMNSYEQNLGHLNNAQKMKELLANLDLDHRSEIIRSGSLVETSDAYYFISVPLGEIEMEGGTKVFAISPEAPIFRAMEGKKAGENFTFNGKEIRIVDVR